MTEGPDEDGPGEAGTDDGTRDVADEGVDDVIEPDEAAEEHNKESDDSSDEEDENSEREQTQDESQIPAADTAPDTVATTATVEGEDDADSSEGEGQTDDEQSGPQASDVPADVRKYDKFTKIDGGTYDRANEFLRDRTYITAREWAIARLCADFRTETGVEMTKIGENLPELVPFMTDTYTPQAVNQARASFEDKVRKSGTTFLYGAMCDFFTAQELDDVMYESTEVAKFLLEVEGVELSVDDELEAEDRIGEVMREVREHSAALRHDEMTCPECGHEMTVEE